MEPAAARPNLFARALRGGALTAGSYAITQVLRLASNLILTRLLFPEAFGLMALVSVVLVGLAMFSDVGIGPAIAQNRRGDDPDFLDTAWTINVGRGVFLWLATCALALPAAALYGAPELALLLPAAGLTLLVAGFNPTRIDTANRHLLLGRVTALDLIAQVIGIVAMILLALAMRSVWALVIGAIIGSAAKLVLMHVGLPGRANRFRWEKPAATELIGFGKWIFLSTACGFLLSQGDKAILGAYLPLDQLGVYNIGYFLASFPILLGGAVTGRILIPLYRDHPPAGSAANFARLRRMRNGVTTFILALLAVMALAGVPLVGLLYDDRYAAAGAIVVAIACVQMPAVIGMTYDQSALAAGDSRSYFLVIAARAAVQTLAFLIGAEIAGLQGALTGQGIALLVVHPLIVWLARRHGAWDARHDLGGFLAVAVLASVALWWNAGALAALG
ncbi:polysaccharide biosynthesis protein [Aliigemmobacter aestuarii]|uniref:Polysaccharide biosynthesis protein n=1 Tax=Aliigemmobacter aestuarii TaxID=1445661 RepID=A0A4S3MPG1_9RHOB|nr:oligosaccharide flippase family protein [Gemmobacter aestuarii]THD83635.1 polysaccharide biosynthesis protein [Gemmobacter aestuarii]